MMRRSWMQVAAAGLAVLAATAPLGAQGAGTPAAAPVPTTTRRPSVHHWEFEFHAGGATSPAPSSGTSELPSIVKDDTAAHTVPSWLFGLGAEVMGDVFALHGAANGLHPLDPVLQTSVASHRGAGFGARVGVSMTRHATLEFGVDDAFTSGLTSSALSSIEETRSDFASGMLATFTPNPRTDVARDISSLNALLAQHAVSILDAAASAVDSFGQAGRQRLLVSGDVRVSFGSMHSITPYLTAGAGLSKPLGASTTLSIGDDYSFQLVLPTGNAPIHETDTVSVEWVQPFRLVTIAGGGLTWPVTERSGLRVDVRGLFGSVRDTVNVTTVTTSAPGAPSGGLFLGTSGAQFNTQPLLVLILANGATPAGAIPRTLIGSALPPNTVVFMAHGWQVQTSVNVGYYFRF